MGRNNMAQDATKNEKVWKFDRCHVNIKVFNRTIITELGENIKQPTIQVDNDPAIDTVHHFKKNMDIHRGKSKLIESGWKIFWCWCWC